MRALLPGYKVVTDNNKLLAGFDFGNCLHRNMRLNQG